MTKTGFLQQKPTEGFVRILPPRKPRVAIGCGAEATRLGCLGLCDDSRPRPAVQPEKNAQLRNYIYSNGGIALKPRKTIIRHSRTLWFAFCRSQKLASQLSWLCAIAHCLWSRTQHSSRDHIWSSTEYRSTQWVGAYEGTYAKVNIFTRLHCELSRQNVLHLQTYAAAVRDWSNFCCAN